MGDHDQEPTAGSSGHRVLAHTADLMLEAWAPTRAGCIAEAVRALVTSFVADPGDTSTVETRDVTFDREPAEDLLVDVLQEVIYLTEVHGAVPVEVHLGERAGGGLEGTFDLVPVEGLEPAGAVPKAVALHRLRCAEDAGGWRCRAVVDV